jgi:hypothetical protein
MKNPLQTTRNLCGIIAIGLGLCLIGYLWGNGTPIVGHVFWTLYAICFAASGFIFATFFKQKNIYLDGHRMPLPMLAILACVFLFSCTSSEDWVFFMAGGIIGFVIVLALSLHFLDKNTKAMEETLREELGQIYRAAIYFDNLTGTNAARVDSWLQHCPIQDIQQRLRLIPEMRDIQPQYHVFNFFHPHGSE